MKKILSVMMFLGVLTAASAAYADPQGTANTGKAGGEYGGGRFHPFQEGREGFGKGKAYGAHGRKGAWKQMRGENSAEKRAQRDERRKDRLEHIQNRIQNNERLTQEQKDKALQFAQSQYDKRTAFRDQQYQEAQAQIEKIKSDASLNETQKKESLQKYFQEKREKGKVFRQEMKKEKQSFWETVRPQAS